MPCHLPALYSSVLLTIHGWKEFNCVHVAHLGQQLPVLMETIPAERHSETKSCTVIQSALQTLQDGDTREQLICLNHLRSGHGKLDITPHSWRLIALLVSYHLQG